MLYDCAVDGRLGTLQVFTAPVEHAGEHGFSRGSYSSYTPISDINDEDGRNADAARSTVRWRAATFRQLNNNATAYVLSGSNPMGLLTGSAPQYKDVSGVSTAMPSENALQISTTRGKGRGRNRDSTLPPAKIHLHLMHNHRSPQSIH